MQPIYVTVAPYALHDWRTVETVFVRDGGVCVACNSNENVACIELTISFNMSLVDRCITLCEQCARDARDGRIYASDFDARRLQERFAPPRPRVEWIAPVDDLSKQEKDAAKLADKVLQGLTIRKELL